MRIRNPLSGLPREVSILVVIAFLVALGFGIVAPAIPLFARQFGVSYFAVGAVISAFAFMRFVSALGAGAIVDRLGERLVLTAGVWIVAVSSALAGLAQTYSQLLLLRGIGGVGSAMFTVSALGLLLRSAGEDQRGRAAGVFQGGFLLGGISGPALGGLIGAYSVRATFFIYAGMLIVAGIFAITALRTSTTAQRPAGGTPNKSERGLAPLFDALRNRSFVTAMVINLGNGFASFGLRASLVPLFVVEALIKGPLLAGIGFFVSAGVQAVFLIPAGRLSDERGRKPALVCGTGAVTVGMLILASSTTPAVFLLGMALLGVGSAFMGSAPAAVVGDVSPARGGTVVAAFQMASDFGAITGPLIAGWLVSQAGYPIAFSAGAAIAAFGLLLAISMQETHKTARKPGAPAPSSEDSAGENA
jgi:MFS family permease